VGNYVTEMPMNIVVYTRLADATVIRCTVRSMYNTCGTSIDVSSAMLPTKMRSTMTSASYGAWLQLMSVCMTSATAGARATLLAATAVVGHDDRLEHAGRQ